jgi:1-acyl-sn-glycerol-3-phosphate acyltransferase
MARHGRVGPHLRFAACIVAPFLRIFTKCRFQHLERIPPHGAAILAANHISHFDPFPFALVAWDAGRAPRFLAKASVFNIPLVGWLLRGCGQIPVHRGTSDAAKALRDAVNALERGELVMFYPEGTLTRDPELWPMVAKTGVSRLALETGAPVLPVAHWGSQDVLWPYAKRFRILPRKTIRAAVGEPVDLSRWKDAEQTSQVLREVTDAIMHEVTLLLASLRDEPAPAKPFQRPARLEDHRRSA